MSDQYVVVLTTLPAAGDTAAEIARVLVGERLAACANLLPAMRSVYRWEGAIQEDDERQLVIKTTGERVSALWTRLRELHPYAVPEFVVLPIADGNPAYLEWIRDSATPAPG